MIRNEMLCCLLGISACFVAGTVARLEGEGIIGGDKAVANQFPYQISLQIYGQSTCGGGIIADQFVLTAAHCVVDAEGKFFGKQMSVLAGTNNLRSFRNSVRREVAKIYVPSGYQPQHGDNVNDIAVLKLKTPLGLSTYDNIRSLDLPKNSWETYAGETVVISGFGWNWVTVGKNEKERGGNTDTELRFAEADVLTTRNCQRNYANTIYESQICAQTKQKFIYKSSGVCSGDSGGPLVYGGNTIVGVVSTSPIGCTEKYAAAVYTRVSSYLDFINNAMKDKKSRHIRTKELIPMPSSSKQSPTASSSKPSIWNRAYNWVGQVFEKIF